MSRRLEWRELKTGVAALAAIVTLVLSILLFARVGALHGDISDIFVLTDDAPGVLNGTEVWLSGEKIGLVKDVHFRPVSTDTLQRLAIHTEILSDRLYLVPKECLCRYSAGRQPDRKPRRVHILGDVQRTAFEERRHSGDTVDRDDETRRRARLRSCRPADSARRQHSPRAHASQLAACDTRRARAHGPSGRIDCGPDGHAAGEDGRKGKEASRRRCAATSADTWDTFAPSRIRSPTSSLRATGLSAASVAIRRCSERWQDSRSDLDSLRSMYSGTGGITRARSDTALTAEMARMRLELAALMADLKKRPLHYISF